VSGFISLETIVLCIPKLIENEDSYTIYSTFCSLVHEAGHKLLRLAFKNQNATTPRGMDPVLADLEGGYRLELILFGTFSFKIFLCLDLIKIMNEKNIWTLNKIPIFEEKDLIPLKKLKKFQVGGQYKFSGLQKSNKIITWKH